MGHMTRRWFVRGGLAAACPLLVPSRASGQNDGSAAPSTQIQSGGQQRLPEVLSGNARYDFWGLFGLNENSAVVSRRASQGATPFNLPGLDIVLGKDSPIFPIAAGEINFVQRGDFVGTLIDIDHGIFHSGYAHGSIQIKKSDKVSRSTEIMKENNFGRNTYGTSHLALRLFGNALVDNDVNYRTGDTLRGNRITVFPQQFDDFPHEHFLMDPDRLTTKSHGQPLIRSFWKGEDFDTPFEAAVNVAEESYRKLADMLTGSSDEKKKEIGGKLNRYRWDPRIPKFVKYNIVWEYFLGGGKDWRTKEPIEAYVKQNGTVVPNKMVWQLRPEDAGGDPILQQFYQLIADVNVAKAKFVITCPYRV